MEGVRVEPTAEFAQLQLGFVDQTQWRYEVIPNRVIILFTPVGNLADLTGSV